MDSYFQATCNELAILERQKGGKNMATFNFDTINNATISLGNGEVVNVKKLSLQINNVMIEENVKLTAIVKNGVLIITTK